MGREKQLLSLIMALSVLFSVISPALTVNAATEYNIMYVAKSYDHDNPTEYNPDTDEDVTLKDATREGYGFNGWYYDSNAIEGTKIETLTRESAAVADNYGVYSDSEKDDGRFTLYANYNPAATFYAEGTDANGNDIFGKFSDENTFKTVLPENEETTVAFADIPTVANYVFKHWYHYEDTTFADAKNEDNSYNITSETDDGNGGTIADYGIYVALYAPVYNFDSNGGKWDDETTIVLSEKEAFPENPEKYNYKFVGWGTTADATKEDVISSLENIDAGTTLYAVWDDINYSVAYRNVFGDVENNNVTEYTANELATDYEHEIKISDIEKTGYGFDGWYATSSNVDDYSEAYIDFEQDYDNAVNESNSKNPLYLFAKWHYELAKTEFDVRAGQPIDIQLALGDSSVTGKFSSDDVPYGYGISVAEDGKITGDIISEEKQFEFHVTATAERTDGIVVENGEELITIRVLNKEVPAYTIPENLTATYGDSVSSVTLPTAENGVWTWEKGDDTVGDVGINSHKATFTPNDKVNYSTETGIDVPLKVNPKNITLTAPTAENAITYGSALKDVNLVAVEAEKDYGTWSWENGDTKPEVPADGQNKTYKAVFTAADSYNSANYTFANTSADAAVVVNPADGVVPSLEVPATVEYTDGMTLADIEINPAGWAWKDSAQTVVVGTNTAEAVYIPEDTVNYKYDEAQLTDTAEFIAETKTPEVNIEFPTVEESYPYGTKLADIPLVGGSSDGWFMWQNSQDTVKLGENGYMVVYHPYITIMSLQDEPIKYEGFVYINGVPATPVMDKLPEASVIYTTDTVSDSEITGGKILGAFGEELEGVWSWNDGDAAYSSAGKYECEATFTPESENYTSITAEIKVTVKKKSSGSSGGGGGGSATKYTITATSGEGGEITPEGASKVIIRQSKEYTIKADEGYEIAEVKVDGKIVETDGTYKFEKVLEDHTIDVTFRAVETDEPEKEEPKEDPASSTPVGFNRTTHVAYVNGYEDGTFMPGDNITRAEATAIICRVLNVPIDETKSYNPSFADVSDRHWAKNYIGYIEELGIINGYEDGTFCPDQTITRAEYLAIVSRIDGVSGTYKSEFSDVADTHWAKDYIGYANGNDWVNGYEDGTFRPDNSVTRAEAVKMTNRVLGRGVNQAGLRDFEITKYTDVTSAHWAYYEIVEASNGHTYTHGDDGFEVWNGLE